MDKNLFKGTDGIENEVEPIGRLSFVIVTSYDSYSPATAGRRILQVRVFITRLETITFIFQNKNVIVFRYCSSWGHLKLPFRLALYQERVTNLISSLRLDPVSALCSFHFGIQLLFFVS